MRLAMSNAIVINTNHSVDISRAYRLSERLLLKEDGVDLLAFDPDSLSVHQLNSSMARIARLCQQSASCEEMVIDFVETYGLEYKEAAGTVLQALQVLDQHEMIVSE